MDYLIRAIMPTKLAARVTVRVAGKTDGITSFTHEVEILNYIYIGLICPEILLLLYVYKITMVCHDRG